MDADAVGFVVGWKMNCPRQVAPAAEQQPLSRQPMRPKTLPSATLGARMSAIFQTGSFFM